ncbi:22526_t:CDS:2 [Entrophospora sp. SA101]|nr:12590_t:CDS:2 [Entrophospora sp. SA101]CAJ0643584.1 12693_t:CDS:2 [Entrophospora sp. SA101]CAJ0754922.1 22526_t:CDS:2 [Entrophospora sp. SA101]CAJ0838659.1 16410_t:CDS:2 [Entrophospora sp. SA101]CAJ0851886.1 2729_t:CDS:2 [Entrophospora sp. SA101]
MYKGNFSYKNDNISVIILNNDIKNENCEDISRIYFVNSQNKVIQIPNAVRLENQKQQALGGSNSFEHESIQPQSI